MFGWQGSTPLRYTLVNSSLCINKSNGVLLVPYSPLVVLETLQACPFGQGHAFLTGQPVVALCSFSGNVATLFAICCHVAATTALEVAVFKLDQPAVLLNSAWQSQLRLPTHQLIVNAAFCTNQCPMLVVSWHRLCVTWHKKRTFA